MVQVGRVGESHRSHRIPSSNTRSSRSRDTDNPIPVSECPIYELFFSTIVHGSLSPSLGVTLHIPFNHTSHACASLCLFHFPAVPSSSSSPAGALAARAAVAVAAAAALLMCWQYFRQLKTLMPPAYSSHSVL